MSQVTKSQKRRPSAMRKYRIHIIIAFLFTAVLGAAFWPAHVWQVRLDREISELQKEKQVLAQQGMTLDEEIRRLKTPEYVEQLARKELGLVKPGEVPISQGVQKKP